MKNLLYIGLATLLFSACTHAPAKKEYSWVSLSDQSYTLNHVTVNKESPDFYSDKGFSDLELHHVSLNNDSTPPPFPLKKDHLQRIVLLGDTGCRLKEGKKGAIYQDCRNPQDWTYPSVAKNIAAEKPDLIIHVGDYHYREQCSEGKPCREMTTTIGPGWKSWEADFIKPSEPAFAVAPWIFVRGNHEDCHRAFEGYKVLLTDQNWEQNCVDHEKTEYIELGDILIVQFDTSSISDTELTPEEQAFWDKEFKAVDETVQKSKAKHIWFVTHKPLLSLVEDDSTHKLHVFSQFLQKSFAKTHLASKVELLIAGHVHDSQFVHIPDYPPQLVVGNGGTALDTFSAFRHPEKIQGTKIDGFKIQEFLSSQPDAHAFGYAVMSRDLNKPDSWTIEFKSISGEKNFEKTIP